jgi:hypothetical protein
MYVAPSCSLSVPVSKAAGLMLIESHWLLIASCCPRFVVFMAGLLLVIFGQ